jgi:hypothetical protein
MMIISYIARSKPKSLAYITIIALLRFKDRTQKNERPPTERWATYQPLQALQPLKPSKINGLRVDGVVGENYGSMIPLSPASIVTLITRIRKSNSHT